MSRIIMLLTIKMIEVEIEMIMVNSVYGLEENYEEEENFLVCFTI